MKDKFYACDTSYGTISVTWKGFSIINPSGSYNRDMHIQQLKVGTNQGANCKREMPFWIDHKDSVVCSPFKWIESKQKYDLDQWNDQYFINLRQIAMDINTYRGLFIFDLYDHCGEKDKPGRPKRSIVNPWITNKQNTRGSWTDKAKKYCEKWEKKVNDTLRGLNWIPTIGNELEARHIEQGKRTLLNMLSKGHKAVYHGLLHLTPGWRKWHLWQKVHFWKHDKNVGEVWHLNGSVKKIKEIGENSENIPLTPPIFFSTDGIGNDVWSVDKIVDKFFKPFLKVKGTSKYRTLFNGKKPPVFEVLNYNNPAACLALNEGHKLLFGKNLKNYGKYEDELNPVPEPVKPEPDPPTPEPEPEKPKEDIMIKNIFDFKGFWKMVYENKKLWLILISHAALIGLICALIW